MSEEKKLRAQIHFRITPDEAKIIERKASEAGLSATMYSKKQALEGKVKSPVITIEIGKLILPELSKIGSNINQIARKLNQGNTVLPTEFLKVQSEFETLWEYILEGKRPKIQIKQDKIISTEEKNSEKIVPICELCNVPMIQKTVKSNGVNFGRIYWSCPNARPNDEHKFGGWVE